jgi:hypothetical protein
VLGILLLAPDDDITFYRNERLAEAVAEMAPKAVRASIRASVNVRASDGSVRGSVAHTRASTRRSRAWSNTRDGWMMQPSNAADAGSYQLDFESLRQEAYASMRQNDASMRQGEGECTGGRARGISGGSQRVLGLSCSNSNPLFSCSGSKLPLPSNRQLVSVPSGKILESIEEASVKNGGAMGGANGGGNGGAMGGAPACEEDSCQSMDESSPSQQRGGPSHVPGARPSAANKRLSKAEAWRETFGAGFGTQTRSSEWRQSQISSYSSDAEHGRLCMSAPPVCQCAAVMSASPRLDEVPDEVPDEAMGFEGETIATSGAI